MKYIELSQGKRVKVYDYDFTRFNKFKWYAVDKRNNFYAVRNIKHGSGQRLEYMHRAILGLTPGDGKEIDHKNRDTLDNRRSNLRIVTRSQNSQNHKLSSNNTSGTTGVHFNKLSGKWVVTIYINRKRIHLGYYFDKNEAIVVRKAAEKKYYGEFAPKR
jgi:hypothetical protein